MRESLPRVTYGVGEILENVNLKYWYRNFIIVRDGNAFTMHFGIKGEIYHRDVAVRTKAEGTQVMGGGFLEIKDGKAALTRDSMAYGGVPKEILKQFVDELKQLLGVKKIKLDPFVTQEDRKRFGLS